MDTVTYNEADPDSIEVLDERGAMIAGIDKDGDDGYVVIWGPGLMKEKSFPTVERAKRWIEKNAGDIADGVSI